MFDSSDLKASNTAEKVMALLEGENEVDFSPKYQSGGLTIDPKIKKKIWLGEYVELGSLAPRTDIKPQENVHPLLRLTTSTRYRRPHDVDEWRRWFHRFSAVYTAKFTDAGPQLFEYVNRIFGLQAKHPNTYIWSLYDEEFRKKKAAIPDLEWHELDIPLLNLVEEEHQVNAKKRNQGGKKFNQKNQSESNPKLQNLPTNGTCLFWNRGSCSTKGKCRWLHACCWCKQDHKASVCPSKK